MAKTARATLRLKSAEIVPSDEDRRVEIGIYDVLLPCRKYEIFYKVAVLGKVSPSLEFILRLVKAIPGISDEDTGAFFGYSQSELMYVLNEALAPGFIERREGRLWLTAAGDGLFRDDAAVPAIFSVEDRKRVVGFDLLAVAPLHFKPLDTIEQWLPELPIAEGAGTGRVVDRIGDRFNRFFHELTDRADKEQAQRRDLYSIDAVVPKDRFQAPVRIRVLSQASNPSVAEIDLTSWRPDHELSERLEVDNSAARLVEDQKTWARHVDGVVGYGTMTDFAPEFFKDFVGREGFSVARYWREAVGRAGDPRRDRQTVPIYGPLYAEGNAQRLLSILEYGLRGKTLAPELILSVAPQLKYWGATTQLRDTMALLKRRVAQTQTGEPPDIKSLCLFSGKPPQFISRTFDEIHCASAPDISPVLELLLIPKSAVAVLVHVPIGVPHGHPVGLGFASFDAKVVGRVESFVGDRLGRFIQAEARLEELSQVFADPT